MYTNQTVIGDLFLDSAFDPREFGYIGLISEDPYSLLGRTDTQIQGWDDFVSRVGEFNFATQSVGTNGHIDILVIGELTGAFGVDDLNFTHYEGSGPAAQAMASGEAQFLGQTAPGTFNDAQCFESLEMVFTVAPRDGTGGKFAPQSRFFLEDIPADGIEEAVQPTNFPRFFAVPPGVEESRLETLRSAFSSVLENDEFRSEIENVHMLTSLTTGQERVTELIDFQYDRFNAAGYIDSGPSRRPYHSIPDEHAEGAALAGERWRGLVEELDEDDELQTALYGNDRRVEAPEPTVEA